MEELESHRRVLVSSVRDALDNVLDPCSVFLGRRLSFNELGMIDAIDTLAGGRVRVRLLLDDPICLYTAQIRKEMTDAVAAVEGVKAVEIEIVGDRLWTADRMSPTARSRLHRVRSDQQGCDE